MIIKNGLVFQEDGTFQPNDICIENQYISKVISLKSINREGNDKRYVSLESDCSDGLTSEDDLIDATGLYVIPGLIDIHFHGCVGYDFCDGTHEAIESMAKYQASNGITTMVPATMTLDDDQLHKIFQSAGSYSNGQGAMLMGIHMEGPYLSEQKKGAQNATYLRTPSVAHFHEMNQLSGNLIKIVSIAPELPGAMDVMKELKEEVVLSLAHSTADYDIAMEAFGNGASHVTHLYNAMNPFSHRAPGILGAAFDSHHCKVELICDGIHIEPAVIRATFKLFGAERIILVSDSMMATGLSDGEYSLGGQAVHVTGNKATLQDGTIAGSATNLMDCVRTAVSYGIPFTDAITCATINPAKEVGIDSQVGSIAQGKYANLVLLDQKLKIVKIILKGVLQKDHS